VVAGGSSEAGNPGTLGMTKRRVGVSSGNWFEGSQVSKARPGAPFGFTLRCCRGHKLCHFSPDSPQRVGCSSGSQRGGQRFQKAFSSRGGVAGAPKVIKNASVQQPPSMEPLPSPLSSRAYPDFLLHCSHQRPPMWFSLRRTTCT
jgi:hypothetical protein